MTEQVPVTLAALGSPWEWCAPGVGERSPRERFGSRFIVHWGEFIRVHFLPLGSTIPNSHSNE